MLEESILRQLLDAIASVGLHMSVTSSVHVMTCIPSHMVSYQMVSSCILYKIFFIKIESHLILSKRKSYQMGALTGLFDFCRTGLNWLGETGLNQQVSGGRNWEKLKIGMFYKNYM